MKEVDKFIFSVIFISILLVSFVSASIFDDVKMWMTGKATNQPTNVSVVVAGTNQVNISVDNSTLSGGVNPIEISNTPSTIYLTVCDPDGVSDINDSATQVIFQKAGDDLRQNTSCSLVGDLDSYCANYSCAVDTWYYDSSGTWTINASANDLGNATRVYNTSFTFTMNQLKALVISPDHLVWNSITPGGTNANADNDPTVVNNTGNYNGVINITGYDLSGATVNTELFGVNNFTADETDGTCAAGTYLNNATTVNITGTNSNPGNLSAGSGTGQEEIYYCIPNVPYVSSQTYETNLTSPWAIEY